MEKVKRFHMRLTDDERLVLEKAADIAGMSMSDFIRTVSLSGARAIVERDEAKLQRVLNSTGRLIMARIEHHSATADDD